MEARTALDALKRYGYTPDSFVTLGDYERFSTDDIDGYVALKRTKRLAVAVSDPVCDAEDLMELVHALRIDTGRRKQRLVFLAVSERTRHMLELMGFASIKTGENGILDLSTYSFDGGERTEVRKHANKAEREGVVVREKRGEDDEAIEALTNAWLSTRRTEGFSLMLEIDPRLFAEEKRVFIAQREGQLVGYLSCAPIYARSGWYFEDLIRSPEAPRGVNQLLVREAIRILREDGYAIATLGAAPLGRIREGEKHERRMLNRTLEFAYEHFNAFYNFKGLAAFKASFAPSSWESQYLCAYPPRITPGVLIGVVELSLPGGIPNAVRNRLADALKTVPKRAGSAVRSGALRAAGTVRQAKRSRTG